MNKYMISALCAVVGSATIVQAAPAEYHRNIGTTLNEEARATAATSDGGSIIAGTRRSAAGGPRSMVLLKLDFKGDTQWERQVIDTTLDEVPLSITQTFDGGYAVVADLTGSAAGLGLGILRVDPVGNYVWGENWFGNPAGVGVHGAKIIELPSGELVVSSRMASGAGQVPSIIRLTPSGGIVWSWGYSDARYSGAQNGSFMDIRLFRDPRGTAAVGLLAVGWTQAATTAPREPLAVWVDGAGAVSVSRTYTPGADQLFNGMDVDSAGLVQTSLIGATTDTNLLQLSAALVPGPALKVSRFIAANESIFNVFGSGLVCGGNDTAATGLASLLGVNFATGASIRRDYSTTVDTLRQIAPANSGVFATGIINSITHGGSDMWAFRTDSALHTPCLEVPVANPVVGTQFGFLNIPMIRSGMQFTGWTPQIPRILDPNNVICLQCPADFNGDGSIDFFDYLDFVNAYTAGTANADFNGDGSIDFFDYLDFVNAFSSGC
jgi:hypothetical protein